MLQRCTMCWLLDFILSLSSQQKLSPVLLNSTLVHQLYYKRFKFTAYIENVFSHVHRCMWHQYVRMRLQTWNLHDSTSYAKVIFFIISTSFLLKYLQLSIFLHLKDYSYSMPSLPYLTHYLNYVPEANRNSLRHTLKTQSVNILLRKIAICKTHLQQSSFKCTPGDDL